MPKSTTNLQDTGRYAILEDERLGEVHEAFLLERINNHTRATYANGIDTFFRFASEAGLDDLLDVEPRHVARFTRALDDKGYETATTRLYLSAIRVFLDACVVGGLISVNPATSVHLPRQSQYRGKTPVIIGAEVRAILDAIPNGPDAQLGDLRDRTLIGLMAYSFFRVSAALKMDLSDYVRRGAQPWIIGEEKGNKRHEMPVHPELEDMLDQLVATAGFEDPGTPLFQSTSNRGGHLTGRRFDRTNAWRMVRRRAVRAGITTDICNHTFRATGITAYLEAGGTIEDARVMANHSSATTTKLYDRTEDTAKVNEVRRISF